MEAQSTPNEYETLNTKAAFEINNPQYVTTKSARNANGTDPNETAIYAAPTDLPPSSPLYRVVSPDPPDYNEIDEQPNNAIYTGLTPPTTDDTYQALDNNSGGQYQGLQEHTGAELNNYQALN